MFTYKSLKMIYYFHAHVHIELKGAISERIGKCKKMGKTLEIDCDMLNTNLSRFTAYTVQKLAQLYSDEWLKNKNMFMMEQKQASLSM